MKLKRRTFLKLAAASLGAFGARSEARPFFLERRRPWYRGEVKTLPSTCDQCFWKCSILVRVEGGRVRKIDGHPENPRTRGRLCPRGQGGIGLLYDPDRLKYPLLRTGKRGEAKFRRASWDEALDFVAERMHAIKEKYGPESVAFFTHGGGESWFSEYLAAAWGTPNVAKPAVSICVAPRETASQWTFGRPVGGHAPVDWPNARYIVLIGHHIGEDTHNTQLQDFAEALRRGAKLVVVDPRLSTAAAKAHRWLPIKPGTDLALLLAWIHVLIKERLYDADYVARYTTGFEALRAHVEPFTPEWAAKITEIPAETIRQVARELGAHRPRAVLPPSRHTVWYGDDTQRMRALFILNALLGNYGREGGFYLAKAPYLEKYPHPPFPLEPAAGGCGGASAGEEEVPEGYRPRADKGKFFAKSTAIQELIEPMLTGEPYPIKGLVAYGTNLFSAIPNVPRTKAALERLELFVAIDVLPQEYTLWADVVLPDATYLERYDDLIAIAYRNPLIQLRQPAVDPLWEARPAWWIARELGIRLGLERFFPWKDVEEYLKTRLEAIGQSLEALKEKGFLQQRGRPWLASWERWRQNPFKTPSGKIELYSETFARAGLDPLPRYTPHPEPPPGHYRLLYGRSPVHSFSKTQNNWILLEMDPENEVWLHPGEAKKLGVRHGDYVWLENPDGVREGPVRVRVTERIRPDCVYLVHGFGHKSPGMRLAHGRGASDTALQTRYDLDPVSGGAGLRNNFVRVVPGAPRPKHPPVGRLARERRL